MGTSEICYLNIFSQHKEWHQITLGSNQFVTGQYCTNHCQAVCQFLGIASYYYCYIHKFANIAGPLHQLTQKGNTFEWTSTCKKTFYTLKEWLTQAPILIYPQFHHNTNKFTLQTDTSASGLEAMLEQVGYVSHMIVVP